MKKILIAILALTLTGSVMAQNRNETVTFYLNYHCGSCVSLVNKNMPHERGVTNFKVDRPAKTLEITYNPRRTNPENLRKALEKMGFVVRNSFDEIKDVPGRSCS
jgi:copper chaperone CopZ